MVQKVPSQLPRSIKPSALPAFGADQGQGNGSLRGTLGSLLEELPIDHRTQALQSVFGLASDALHLINAQRQCDIKRAEYRRDMHLSDNEVRKAKLHLKEVLADTKRQRLELQSNKEFAMQAQADTQQQFDQKMAEIRQLLADYRRTRDPNTLTMATHLIGFLRD